MVHPVTSKGCNFLRRIGMGRPTSDLIYSNSQRIILLSLNLVCETNRIILKKNSSDRIDRKVHQWFRMDQARSGLIHSPRKWIDPFPRLAALLKILGNARAHAQLSSSANACAHNFKKSTTVPLCSFLIILTIYWKNNFLSESSMFGLLLEKNAIKTIFSSVGKGEKKLWKILRKTRKF